jgi:hypothetical protein
MVCLSLSKKNFLKLTLSLLTAFIILLGGIDHADANISGGGSLGNDLLEANIDYSCSDSSNTYFLLKSEYNLSDLATIGYIAGGSWGNYFINYNGSDCVDVDLHSVRGGISITDGDYSFVWSESNDYGQDFSSSGFSEVILKSTNNVLSLKEIFGCMDNMAINYDPTANVDSGGCYYILPEETATSTRIINYTFSTSTNQIDLSYYVATSTEILLYVENRNERDGVINSAFSSTTAGLTALTNIPVTLPNPLNGAGYTYFTTKLVLASDRSVIFDWSVITVDLYAGVSLGGGSGVGTGYQPAECGITNLGGCFMNGLAVMFYPSQQAFNNFNSFVDLIKTKPPVGYFYVVKNNLNNLTSTSTSAFTVTIPNHIKEYLFTPFDVGIGGILWFFFAINFYKRLKHITV